MRTPVKLLAFACVAAGLTQPVQAADWVSIAKSDRTEVFANPASLGVSPSSWVTIRTKQNFVEPQAAAKKGKTYRSARNEYRVDCTQRRLAYQQMEAFPELDLVGTRVQKAKIGEKNLKWMDAPTGTIFGEILDYACENAPSVAVPTAR